MSAPFLSARIVPLRFQAGGLKYHSTALALVELTDSLYSHLDNHETIISMYFDVQKAFDTVDHEILLTKLYNYGVRGPINDWFRDYLTNRKQ